MFRGRPQRHGGGRCEAARIASAASSRLGYRLLLALHAPDLTQHGLGALLGGGTIVQQLHAVGLCIIEVANILHTVAAQVSIQQARSKRMQ